MFGNVRCLKCSVCGKEFQPCKMYLCDVCGGNVNAEYNKPEKAILKDVDSYWRYLPMLPLPQEAVPGPWLPVGRTPLIAAPKLQKQYDLKANLFVKDESKNPSGSLKDRASFLLTQMAEAHGIDTVITASTGNAGCALACCCAAHEKVQATILVPKSAPAGKIAQLLAFGAKVLLVDGCYDDAFNLCTEVANKRGLFNRNTGMNPFTSEGKKTVSFEMFEQLGDKAPDYVFVSVGDGNIITGVYKGFKQLHELGLIEKMPKLMACQSSNSNFFVQIQKELAEKNITDEEAIRKYIHEHKGIGSAPTRADSISAALPSDRVNAYFAVIKTGGKFVEVTDEEILLEIPFVSRNSGVFPEPAASCAFAGLRKVVSDLKEGENVVVLSTGTCLKDIKALEASGMQGTIVKTISDVEKAIL